MDCRIFEVGDDIEVIDKHYASYPIRGKILAVEDNFPVGYPEYKIEVNDSPALPRPEIWVSGRFARKVE